MALHILRWLWRLFHKQGVTMQVPNKIIDRTLAKYFSRNGMTSIEAKVELASIGYQESNFKYTKQIGGPAVGYWQFEKIGILGVMKHYRTKDMYQTICVAEGVEPDVDSVYEALPSNPVLACAFARLYLWTDINPLPNIGDVEDAWDCYIRIWRPGKPDRSRWDTSYGKGAGIYNVGR